MASNVFRITPRVAHVIRAIEDKVQAEYDSSVADHAEHAMRAVFNYGDFKFFEAVEGETVVVMFDKVEIMFTLPGDRECFLIDYHCRGKVYIKQQNGLEGVVFYSTEGVELDTLPTGDMQQLGPVFVRHKNEESRPNLTDIPLPI